MKPLTFLRSLGASQPSVVHPRLDRVRRRAVLILEDQDRDLTKPVNDVALVHAIAALIERSRAALDRELDMRMLISRYASLTPREREVMVLVVSGLLNKQIGGELGISEITVKAHRGRVMRKMEAASLPHLLRMAAQLGPRHLRTNRETPWASA